MEKMKSEEKIINIYQKLSKMSSDLHSLFQEFILFIMENAEYLKIESFGTLTLRQKDIYNKELGQLFSFFKGETTRIEQLKEKIEKFMKNFEYYKRKFLGGV